MERFEFAIIMIVATFSGFILWFITAIYGINFSIPLPLFVLLNLISIGMSLRRHFKRKAEESASTQETVNN